MAKLRYGAARNKSREENFKLVREGTAKDIEEMLTKHEIALMIRPTGFGKTYTMIRLCELAKYQKIVYLYPTDVIKTSVIDDYHDSYIDENGRRIHDKSGRKFNMNSEEEAERPDLPTLAFYSYSKMLRDWNEAYKYTERFGKISEKKQEEYITKWKNVSTDEQKKSKLNVQRNWLKERLKNVDLLIIDEAHMVGANGFMEYWPHIRQMFMGPNKIKESRLHVVGATATPLRTNADIDIEREVFYYNYGGKKKSARIRDFTIIDCWEAGILPKPYYIKGVLNKEKEIERIEELLRENLISAVTVGRNTSTASKVTITNSYTENKQQEFTKELRAMQSAFTKIKEPSEIIRIGIEEVNRNGIESGDYMRFIVFYQDTNAMIEHHEEINDAFRKALEIGESDKFNRINTIYLVSNKEKATSGGLKTSSIDDISKRTAYLEKINYNLHEVDIIHCIDMLNMGYHVGMVTGVVINRSTGSEIKYYQQIGRCMSVKSNQTPLIIDFDNADSALFKRAMDSLRREAMKRIREFTKGCSSGKETKELNAIYARVKLSISLDEIPDDLLEYYYFDRMAPIYFIHAIGKALKCQESLDSIVYRLFDIARDNKKYSVDDIIDDNYLIGEIRLSKRFKNKTLDKVAKAVEKVRQEQEEFWD